MLSGALAEWVKVICLANFSNGSSILWHFASCRYARQAVNAYQRICEPKTNSSP
jgi:hypothetical protein